MPVTVWLSTQWLAKRIGIPTRGAYFARSMPIARAVICTKIVGPLSINCADWYSNRSGKICALFSSVVVRTKVGNCCLFLCPSKRFPLGISECRQVTTSLTQSLAFNHRRVCLDIYINTKLNISCTFWSHTLFK